MKSISSMVHTCILRIDRGCSKETAITEALIDNRKELLKEVEDIINSYHSYIAIDINTTKKELKSHISNLYFLS